MWRELNGDARVFFALKTFGAVPARTVALWHSICGNFPVVRLSHTQTSAEKKHPNRSNDDLDVSSECQSAQCRLLNSSAAS
jgi:hypothetical protein